MTNPLDPYDDPNNLTKAGTRPIASPPGPLQQQYRQARSTYDNATSQAQTLADQRQKLTAGTTPLVREGRGGAASITGYTGGAPGTNAAVAEIDKRLGAANATRTALAPTFYAWPGSSPRRPSRTRRMPCCVAWVSRLRPRRRCLPVPEFDVNVIAQAGRA